MNYDDKARSLNRVGICLTCGKLRRISVRTCLCVECAKEGI